MFERRNAVDYICYVLAGVSTLVYVASIKIQTVVYTKGIELSQKIWWEVAPNEALFNSLTESNQTLAELEDLYYFYEKTQNIGLKVLAVTLVVLAVKVLLDYKHNK